MPETYSKEALLKLGIYDLRAIARQVGVKAPTTLNKDQIINGIVSLLGGKEKPQHSSLGRPSKDNRSFNEALKLIKYESVPKEEYYTPKKILSSFGTFFASSVQIPTVATGTLSGYVRLMMDNTAVVMEKGYLIDDFEHNAVIMSDVFSDYCLKDGDYVECYIKSLGDDKPNVVTDVISINGFNAKELNNGRVKFADLVSYYPNKRMRWARGHEKITNLNIHDFLLPIGFGSRLLVSFDEKANRTEAINKYAERLVKDNNVKTIVVALGESPEDIQEFKEFTSDAEIIYQDKISDSDILELLDIKINHLIRMVELNYDVCLIISNFTKFKGWLKEVLKIDTSTCEGEAILNKKLLNLMNLAKFTKEKGSFTLFACCQDDTFDAKHEYALSTTNAYIKHNKSFYDNTYITVDLFESFINKCEKFYTASEIVKSDKFFRDLKEEDIVSRLKQIIK